MSPELHETPHQTPEPLLIAGQHPSRETLQQARQLNQELSRLPNDQNLVSLRYDNANKYTHVILNTAQINRPPVCLLRIPSKDRDQFNKALEKIFKKTDSNFYNHITTWIRRGLNPPNQPGSTWQSPETKTPRQPAPSFNVASDLRSSVSSASEYPEYSYYEGLARTPNQPTTPPSPPTPEIPTSGDPNYKSVNVSGKGTTYIQKGIKDHISDAHNESWQKGGYSGLKDTIKGVKSAAEARSSEVSSADTNPSTPSSEGNYEITKLSGIGDSSY